MTLCKGAAQISGQWNRNRDFRITTDGSSRSLKIWNNLSLRRQLRKITGSRCGPSGCTGTETIVDIERSFLDAMVCVVVDAKL